MVGDGYCVRPTGAFVYFAYRRVLMVHVHTVCGSCLRFHGHGHHTAPCGPCTTGVTLEDGIPVAGVR